MGSLRRLASRGDAPTVPLESHASAFRLLWRYPAAWNCPGRPKPAEQPVDFCSSIAGHTSCECRTYMSLRRSCLQGWHLKLLLGSIPVEEVVLVFLPLIGSAICR